MSNCTLCDLVAHTIPVSVAYEYSTIFAFMDIKPVNYGHVVIVPKKHVVYMAELDEDAGAELFKVTMRVAQAVRRLDIKCEAVNLFLADGEAAGQEQFHVHMHVIPRFKDDRFTLQIDYPTRPTREDLDKTAERIRLLTS